MELSWGERQQPSCAPSLLAPSLTQSGGQESNLYYLLQRQMFVTCSGWGTTSMYARGLEPRFAASRSGPPS